MKNVARAEVRAKAAPALMWTGHEARACLRRLHLFSGSRVRAGGARRIPMLREPNRSCLPGSELDTGSCAA